MSCHHQKAKQSNDQTEKKPCQVDGSRFSQHFNPQADNYNNDQCHHPRESLDDHDHGSRRGIAGEFPALQHPDDITADSRGQKCVKEGYHEIVEKKFPEGSVYILGPQ